MPSTTITVEEYSHGSYRWWLIGILWFVCFCNYADRQAIFSIFPLLRSELRFTDVQLGVVASSFMWMYALAGPFAGWIADRVSARSLVLGALLFWSGMTMATAICHSFSSMVFFRALGGLGEAFYFPAVMILIGLYHSDATRSRAMALHQSSVYAGTIAGGTFSGLIAQNYSWRASFVVFGVAGLLLMGVLMLMLRRPSQHAPLVSDQNFFHVMSAVLSDLRVLTLIGVFIGQIL